MTIIAMTGQRIARQADIAELVLESTASAGLASLWIALGVDRPDYITAMRSRGHLVELWRIGHDASMPELDNLLTASITDEQLAAGTAAAVERELQAFYFRAAALGGKQPTHQEKPF